MRAGAWTRSLSFSTRPSRVRLKPRRSRPSVPPEGFGGEASPGRSSEELIGSPLSFRGPLALSQGLLGLGGLGAGGIEGDHLLEILRGFFPAPREPQCLSQTVVALKSEK